MPLVTIRLFGYGIGLYVWGGKKGKVITHINKFHNLKLSKMLNYTKLMALNPTVYATFTNSIGQELKLVEHPIQGMDAEVIVVSDYHKLAAYSTFYDTIDMLADHKEYEPSFIDGKLYIGEFSAD